MFNSFVDVIIVFATISHMSIRCGNRSSVVRDDNVNRFLLNVIINN